MPPQFRPSSAPPQAQGPDPMDVNRAKQDFLGQQMGQSFDQESQMAAQQQAELARVQQQEPTTRRERLMMLLENFTGAFAQGLQGMSEAAPGQRSAGGVAGALQGRFMVEERRRQMELEDQQLERQRLMDQYEVDQLKLQAQREHLMFELEKTREERAVQVEERDFKARQQEVGFTQAVERRDAAIEELSFFPEGFTGSHTIPGIPGVAEPIEIENVQEYIQGRRARETRNVMSIEEAKAQLSQTAFERERTWFDLDREDRQAQELLIQQNEHAFRAAQNAMDRASSGDFTAPENAQLIIDAEFAAVDQLIGEIEDLSSRVNTGNRAQQFGKVALSFVWQDDDIKLLKSKAGRVGDIVRLFGERGALAEGDIERAMRLLPTGMTPAGEADSLIASLVAAVKDIKTKKLAALTGGAPYPPPGDANYRGPAVGAGAVQTPTTPTTPTAPGQRRSLTYDGGQLR